jgi:hypothetical protein
MRANYILKIILNFPLINIKKLKRDLSLEYLKEKGFT